MAPEIRRAIVENFVDREESIERVSQKLRVRRLPIQREIRRYLTAREEWWQRRYRELYERLYGPTSPTPGAPMRRAA